jgi:ribonuclease HI
MYQVDLYVDGACSGNPGPAGVGIILKHDGKRREFWMAIGDATNNIAEIRAVIEGIKLLKAPELTDLTVYTDSQLVEGLLVRGWKPRCNRELAEEMKALARQCGGFKVVKVKAHNGIRENEACHILAQVAVREVTQRVGFMAGL